MRTLARLGPADLRAAFVVYRDLLHAHRHVIDRLNVFPVPDADTGTNLSLTLDAVARELESASDMASTAHALGHGALMGARGISGVITAQLLRTAAERVAGVEAIDGPLLAAALIEAAGAAHAAVSRPVEGTILTVAREAAGAAARRASEGGTLLEVLEAGHRAAWGSVERTPDLLPVLREAGVVDGGGTGFALLFDALLHVVADRPLPDPADRSLVPVPPTTAEGRSPGPPPDGSGLAAQALGERGDTLDRRFEVALMLEAPDEAVPALRERWERLGGAVVVVGGDGRWSCHLHTDQPSAAVAAAGSFGRASRIRVTDLALQVVGERGGPVGSPERTRTAAVAVGAGDGVHRLFRSLGAHVVTGSGSLNPSVGELLQAVRAAAGDEVLLLPNDEDVIPAAEQARGRADTPVVVVPTRGIVDGMAALRAFDPDAPAQENAAAMLEAARSVRFGRLVRAARDAGSQAGPIRQGDWLGMTMDGVAVVRPQIDEAGRALLERLLSDRAEIVTIIEGEGATEEVTDGFVAWLQATRPDLGIQVLRGGQPIHAYVFGLE